MERTDRFLFGIVTGVVVLVCVAFTIALTRPAQSYELEDSPDGVAHNYLFALQSEELERAYRYISPTIKNYPASSSAFTNLVMENRWILLNNVDEAVTLQVESSRIRDSRATVYVSETRFQHGLLASSQDFQTFRMYLQMEDGEWKIIDADNYWLQCLRLEEGCKQ